MHRPVLAALLLLWCPVALAQAGEAQPPATQQDPESAYKDLVKAANKARAAWQAEAMKAIKEAEEAGKPPPAIAMTPPTKEFVSRAQELANQYAGTDDAVRFLVFICKNASNERNAVNKAGATLAQAHVESPAIGDALGHLEQTAMRFGITDKVMALLDDVVAHNKTDTCIAQALITRGSLRLQNPAATDEERKAAEEDLRKVATVTKDEALQKQAKDALFEIEHLQVGCKAPEIAGKDVDGVDFKLADYLGKVVLLDFWGFW